MPLLSSCAPLVRWVWCALALCWCCVSLVGCALVPLDDKGSKKGSLAVAPPPSTTTITPATEPPHQATGPPCLVLALPESDHFAPFSERIRNGAHAAQKEMERGGYKVQVQTVDTTQPDWLTSLESLPARCAVVGGPLHATSYAQVKTANSRRHFFTFLPHLGEEEGKTAWRFFPSPTDQVAALLRFTRQELGITGYGIFYPSDAYGARMAGLFAQAVRAEAGTVQDMSYQPADMGQWTKAAESLLRPRMVNKVPISTATFEATFLPDSWKNMDMVTTSLLYNGEDRQVLLGTTLWEQSLSAQGTASTHYYSLAVFPGAWDTTRVPPALQQLGPTDFWVGLGYDFVRFGAALGLPGSVSASEVNSRILHAQNMPWAMAPMEWNAKGQARQHMFLFVPTASGFAPLDVPAFKERREQARTRFDNRSRAAAQGK